MADIYDITNQVEEEELTPRGTFRKVIVVYYKSKVIAFEGSVTVPEEQYNAETVDVMIRQKLQHRHAVEDL